MATVGGWIDGRQTDRMSETIKVAAADLAKHLESGGVLSRAFASSEGSEHSAAEDIAEGVLQTVAFSYEQKKAPYLGHLLAGLATRSDLSIGDAHYMTRLVGRLSYRQLAILAMIDKGKINGDRMMNHTALMQQAIADEMEELSATYALIGSQEENPEGEIATFSGLNLVLSLPKELRLTHQGHLVFNLLQLDTVPEQDQQDSLSELLGSDGDMRLPVLKRRLGGPLRTP